MSGEGLAQRTVSVLRSVGSAPAGIGLSQIARNTDIPKATCLRILNVLSEENLVALDPETKLYRVALGMLSLMSGVLDEGNVYGAVQRELTGLADSTRETVGIDILDDDGVLVVLQVQGPQLITQTAKPVPRTLPEWCTSTGKVLNAWRPPADVRRRLVRERSTREAEVFLEDLERTRARGYGVAFDELEVGAAAVAVPIHYDGEVAAALWVGGPTYRLTRERIVGLADELQEPAGRIEELLSATRGWLFHATATGNRPGDGRLTGAVAG